MKTIVKLMLGASFLVATLAPPGQAGTTADPEYTDPARDVPYLLSPGDNADWADVVGAWFEPIDGGVRVNIATLEGWASADKDASLYINWDVLGGQAEHCYAGMSIQLTDGDERAFAASNARLSYVCQGEEQPFTIPIADVTIQVNSQWNAGALTLTTDGPVASVDVPFSAFQEGKTSSLYVAGTGLQITSVQSQIIVDPWFLIGDTQEMCKPTYTPPFGFESGCPDDARIYTIGS